MTHSKAECCSLLVNPAKEGSFRVRGWTKEEYVRSSWTAEDGNQDWSATQDCSSSRRDMQDCSSAATAKLCRKTTSTSLRILPPLLALRSGGGGFEPRFNLGSTWVRTFLFFHQSSNLGSTWSRAFGRVRVVPAFGELNMNLGSTWVLIGSIQPGFNLG